MTEVHDTKTKCTCPEGQHKRENYISGTCQRDYHKDYIRSLVDCPQEKLMKAKYKQAMEYFAEKKGISVEELGAQLDEARGRPRNSECLEPHEIQHVVDGGDLHANRRDHLRDCDDCRAVVLSSLQSD